MFKIQTRSTGNSEISATKSRAGKPEAKRGQSIEKTGEMVREAIREAEYKITEQDIESIAFFK